MLSLFPPLPSTDGQLVPDSIPTVDLSLLSQSEVYSLSLYSHSAFDPHDDIVTAKLDRSFFNESAGSRKQTYSRLRFAPAASSSVRRRRHHRLPHHNQPSLETDPENFRIASLLKQVFIAEMNPADLISIPVDYSKSVAQFLNVPPDKSFTADLKFEHSSPSNGNFSKNDVVIYENSVNMDKEIANADGVPVDLVALGSLQDPFAMELRRRTEGHEGEVMLLGFLQGLKGQWGSRRKKRRIVDASEFGNTLPKGWKLLLSLKRKAGYVWVYCRSYISPSGRQFVSCKEVSIYLLSPQSIFEGDKPGSTDTTKMVQIVDNVALDVTNKEAIVSNMVINDPVQDILMLGNLQEVHVVEIAHCKNCNLDFDDKDGLMQHLSYFHKSANDSLQLNVSSQTDSTLQEPTVLEQVFSEANGFNAESKLSSLCGEDLNTFCKSKSADEPEDSCLVGSEKAPASGSVLHCSAINVEACDFDEFQLERDSPGVNKDSISEQTEVLGMHDVPMSDVPATNRGSEDGLKTLSVDVEEHIDNLNLFFSTCDDMLSCGESNSDHVSNLVEENHFGCTPSWGKDVDSAEKYGSLFPECFEEGWPIQQAKDS